MGGAPAGAPLPCRGNFLAATRHQSPEEIPGRGRERGDGGAGEPTSGRRGEPFPGSGGGTRNLRVAHTLQEPPKPILSLPPSTRTGT